MDRSPARAESPAEGMDVSVVIVSFNTRDLLRDCLRTATDELRGLRGEILVVDNASADGSAEMVRTEFPDVKLLESKRNLGFGAANNAAFRCAQGRYLVLLNSDAFPAQGSVARALDFAEQNPHVGYIGGKLVGRDGGWQPSARMFPSLLNEFLMVSGMAARFSGSRFFGRADRTWADVNGAAAVDWAPGAFAVIPRAVLDAAGMFDEDFFLYYEEVDLCRRILEAGYLVQYLPSVEIIHLGGESSRSKRGGEVENPGSQIALWRMRSAFLYYRKHHGAKAWLAKNFEYGWNALRLARWRFAKGAHAGAKRRMFRETMRLLNQAWNETGGGRISPPRPW